MAFQKKTWVNRVAQYPLRRLLTVVRNFDATNTAVMDIQREEGEVTTEGDAFSAENMNDLENRIKQGFDDAGGGNFVGVRYHASLVDYPDYPCWEDMTADDKAKYDISTGATINFLDDEAIPDDILGDTDISGIGDGTLTGAIDEHDTKIASLNNELSHIGMIIHSTTLDTEAKVKAIYGSNTSWIQHSGYVLRGATSGVVANSATKTGGNDNAIVVSHSHTTYPAKNSSGGSIMWVTMSGGGSGQNVTSNGSTNTVGESGTNKNIPNYKSVYIWERTA